MSNGLSFLLPILQLAILVLLTYAGIKLRWRFIYLDKQFKQQTEFVEQQLAQRSLEIQNAAYLSGLGLRFPLFFGYWSIETFLARYLVQHLMESPPQVILELGSGSSSVLIARCMQLLEYPKYRHFAVDHEKRYLNLTKKFAKLNQLDMTIDFLECPLEKAVCSDYEWYSNLTEHLSGVSIDLLIIDGPPGELQKNSRYPALPMLYPFLSEHCTIILDDANREDERAIVACWIQEFPEFTVSYQDIGHGFAILTR